MKNTFYIENGFDGSERIKNKYFEVVDGIITEISDHSDSCSVRSFEGQFVTPGFIDCHIHLFSSPTDDLDMNNPVERVYTGLKNASELMKQGFFYVRDCGAAFDDSLQLRDLIDKTNIEACRIVASGQPISITGGHGCEMSIQADGVEEVRKAVRSNIHKNVDFIKLMVTTGVNAKGMEMAPSEFTYEEIEMAVKTAHNFGRKVAVHTHGYSGIKNSIAAGVDSIEHGVCLSEDLIPGMLEKKIYLVPTLSAPYFAATRAMQHDPDNPDHRKSKEVMAMHNNNIFNAYKSGVTLAYGTDCGTPYNYHAEDLLECELLHNIGIESEYILKMMTANAADCCGLNSTGRLKKGMQFDAVVHTHDVIEDISKITEEKILIRKGEELN